MALQVTRYTTLQSSFAPSKPRKATLEGINYLIFPCIAIMADIVVQGLGSTGPEYVPADVLAELPEAWNSRPVLYNHPPELEMEANSPDVFEAQRLGQMFNTRLVNGHVQPEVWIDLNRLPSVNAEELAERLANPKSNPISVSVGVWLWIKQEQGTSPDGTPYEYIWQRIVPNHLAILPPELGGACSVETGCRLGGFGAKNALTDAKTLPSGAQNAIVTCEENTMKPNLVAAVNSSKDQESKESEPKAEPKLGLFARFISLFRNLVEDQGPSDQQLRQALSKLLRGVEPGFDWIDKIYAQSKTIIYYCWDNGSMRVFHRSYNHDEATGEITLNDDREEGQIIEQFVPLNPQPSIEPVANVPPANTSVNASQESNVSTPCACHKSNNSDELKELNLELQAKENQPMADPNTTPNTTPDPVKETPPVTPNTPTNSPVSNPTPNPNPTPVVPPAANLSPEEEEKAYLANMPQSLRGMFDRHLAADKAHRSNLKKQILAKQVGKAYTEANLEPMTTEALEALSSALGVRVDFSGVSATVETDERESKKPVSAWDRMLANRGKNKGNGSSSEATAN